jgi:segregation and condensation protein A
LILGRYDAKAMTFRVELNIYRGPLDLLLYLVRKHELDISDIPIALVADQFIAHLDVLEELSVDDVGEFLDLASTLVEIKSRMVLPSADEVDEPLEDPRQELVQRLLEYRRFREAASMLEDRGRQWQRRYPRLSDDLPPRKIDPANQPIREVELWDLVSALGRLLKFNAPRSTNIVYDETPVSVWMARLHTRLAREGQLTFGEFFAPGMHKSSMIGVFLAILELVRHHHVLAEQTEGHGEIVISRGAKFSDSLELANLDEYEGSPPIDAESETK